MFIARLLPLAAAAACSFAASAEVQWMAHSFELTLQQSAQSGLAPHPNVIKFYGMSAVSLSQTPEPSGVVTNPLYADKGLSGTNPFYKEKDLLRDRAAQFEVTDFASIFVDFSDTTYFLHDNNIVHRDLAARNILVRTSQGDYLPAHNFVFNFSSDGPLDYKAFEPKIPIRWSAPEILTHRLFLNGDESSSDWLDIGPGATFETYAIPSPAGASLLALAALTFTRRRR